jgi:hypothetical protein
MGISSPPTVQTGQARPVLLQGIAVVVSDTDPVPPLFRGKGRGRVEVLAIIGPGSSITPGFDGPDPEMGAPSPPVPVTAPAVGKDASGSAVASPVPQQPQDAGVDEASPSPRRRR